MEKDAREERLKLIQDVRVYPVGRVLRETFDADNHHTLGSDVAGLMIDLSRVPFDPADNREGKAVSPPPGTSRRPDQPERRGLFRKLGALLRGH